MPRILVVLIKHSVVHSVFEFDSVDEAENKFLELCKQHVKSKFEDWMVLEDIKDILENGYITFVDPEDMFELSDNSICIHPDNSICIHHLMSPEEKSKSTRTRRRVHAFVEARISKDVEVELAEDDVSTAKAALNKFCDDVDYHTEIRQAEWTEDVIEFCVDKFDDNGVYLDSVSFDLYKNVKHEGFGIGQLVIVKEPKDDKQAWKCWFPGTVVGIKGNLISIRDEAGAVFDVEKTYLEECT